MDIISLKEKLQALVPGASFPDNKQFAEIIVPADRYHDFCQEIKSLPDLKFDFLISITAVDWNDHFMIVSHITSTELKHTLVVKTRIDSRDDPWTSTVSDIWKTAEFHEREIFDMFGIRFKDHPDLRRLFLDDDYGFPLRKDFKDESRMIVK